MSNLKPCRWRSAEPLSPGRWGCASSKLLVPPEGVPEEVCRKSCYCVDHEPTGGEAPTVDACIHRGKPTGKKVDCKSCKGTVQLPLLACSIYGECVQGKSLESAQGCGDCTRRESPLAVVVTADGIGDHLLGMAAGLAQCQGSTRRLTVVAKPHVLPWLELFDVATATTLPKGTKVVCDVADRGTKHYADAIRSHLMAMPVVRSDVVADPRYSGAIVMAPFSKWEVREWPLERWLELEGRLLAKGLDVVTIGAGSNAKDLERFAGETWSGKKPREVAALMLAASCVVGNDSGMAHLTGALGRPALVLSAILDGKKIHGAWPSSTVIQRDKMDAIDVKTVAKHLEKFQ